MSRTPSTCYTIGIIFCATDTGPLLARPAKFFLLFKKGSTEIADFRTFEIMARPTGFEPVAPRLGIWCSILLSYGRTARPV